jgi:hypothetical protein
MRAGYGEKLRGYLANRTNPLLLIDFGGTKIFDSATVDTDILQIAKEENKGKTISCEIKNDSENSENKERLDNLSDYVKRSSLASIIDFSTNKNWIIMSDFASTIQKKVELQGHPLKQWKITMRRGILTGMNEAFIINKSQKDALCIKSSNSAEIIQPILRGRDVKRYSIAFKNFYIIALFPSKKYDIEKYPAIKDYLLSFNKRRLAQSGEKWLENGNKYQARKKTSNKWYETQDQINYWDDFLKPKIVYPDICSEFGFAFDLSGSFLTNTCYFITANNRQLLKGIFGILNSSLIEWYYAFLSAQLGKKALRMFSIYIEQIPISEEAVWSISQLPGSEAVSSWIPNNKKAIDKIVFDSYQLTNSEIAFINESLI